MTIAAAFIFEGQPSLQLPRMMDMLRGTLGTPTGRITGASLSALTFTDADLTMTLTLALLGSEARITLALSGKDATLARLATLSYTLAKDTDAAAVIWHDTDVRIPRAAFLAGLAHSMEPAAAPVAVAPRRIAARSTPQTARPGARPVTALRPQQAAHVRAYEVHIGQELRRSASVAEMDVLRTEYETQKNRMSALTSGATAALQSAELRAASLVICVTSLVVTSGAVQMI